MYVAPLPYSSSKLVWLIKMKEFQFPFMVRSLTKYELWFLFNKFSINSINTSCSFI